MSLQGGGADGLIVRAEAQSFASPMPDAAVADLGDALKLAPFSGIARFDRGLIYLQTGKYPFAIEDFTAAIEVNPDDLDLLYERGWAL